MFPAAESLDTQKTEKHVLWIIIKTISDFKNQLYVRELLSKDNSRKKRTTYKAMSSGEITVGARKQLQEQEGLKTKIHYKKEHCGLFTTKILLLHIGNLSIQDHLV